MFTQKSRFLAFLILISFFQFSCLSPLKVEDRVVERTTKFVDFPLFDFIGFKTSEEVLNENYTIWKNFETKTAIARLGQNLESRQMWWSLCLFWGNTQ